VLLRQTPQQFCKGSQLRQNPRTIERQFISRSALGFSGTQTADANKNPDLNPCEWLGKSFLIENYCVLIFGRHHRAIKIKKARKIRFLRACIVSS
jgi:hypothetical protein